MKRLSISRKSVQPFGSKELVLAAAQSEQHEMLADRRLPGVMRFAVPARLQIIACRQTIARRNAGSFDQSKGTDLD